MSNKRSYQSTVSYIWVFTVLPTRCHTKGSTNLQAFIDLYFLLGIHQEDLGWPSTTTANHYLESAKVCRASEFIGSYIWV